MLLSTVEKIPDARSLAPIGRPVGLRGLDLLRRDGFPGSDSAKDPDLLAEELDRRGEDVYFAPHPDELREDTVTDVLPRLASGDPGAAEECLDRYGALVWSLARRHLRGSTDAEDAVQDIFVDVWKNAARFDAAKASEAAFITMIARRRLIDRIRHTKRRPATLQLEPELDMPDPMATKPEASAEASLAARAIARLQPKERDVVLLSTYHGMSHGQIAERTGLPLGTVKTYARRGLLRIRESLEGRSKPLEGVGK